MLEWSIFALRDITFYPMAFSVLFNSPINVSYDLTRLEETRNAAATAIHFPENTNFQSNSERQPTATSGLVAGAVKQLMLFSIYPFDVKSIAKIGRATVRKVKML